MEIVESEGWRESRQRGEGEKRGENRYYSIAHGQMNEDVISVM